MEASARKPKKKPLDVKKPVPVKKKAVPVKKPALAKKAIPVKKPVATFRIRGLDPQAKCGPATSVKALYRVDESVDGTERPHLVFLDRHGWYCEHGRDCPAVGFARKHDDGVAREGNRT